MKNFSLLLSVYVPVPDKSHIIKISILNIQKAYYNVYNTYNSIYYKVYYYNLRQSIYRANTIHDLVSIVKSISNRYSSSDDILNILVECFTRYPLRETELQKLSIWQQEYENTHDICNYASTVIWIAVIYYINR